MAAATPSPDPTTDDLVAKRVQAMKDDELADFIRTTVVRLEALADRLDVLADEVDPPPEESRSA